jgi:uncharacterized protein (TIGR03435 family)
MLKSFLAGLWMATAVCAQTPPAFEVASIKTAPPIEPQKIMAGTLHIGMKIDSARVDIGGLSLTQLICIAYKVKPYQVTGPDWMMAQRFDILAKMPEGADKDQVPQMLQGLLAERFKLKIRRDSKEQAVYALVVGKNGPKMVSAEPDPVARPQAEETAPPKGSMSFPTPEGQMRMTPNADGKGATLAGGPFGQMKISMGEAGRMRMEFAKLDMTGLCELLSRFADRPVVDQTELKGKYQVPLDLSMEEMRNVARTMAAQAGISVPGPMGPGGAGAGASPADAASTPSGSSIMGAVQQLGLKLEPKKAPIDMLVVEHIERAPTEN